MSDKIPFWKCKTLAQMSREEWEMLCDGCGKCCLEKLENQRKRKVSYTSVACEFLDITTCRCKIYDERYRLMPDCLTLTLPLLAECYWLPKTCAYRLLFEGKELYDWHPLVSGDPESVHKAGISVRHKVISGKYIEPHNLEAYVLETDI